MAAKVLYKIALVACMRKHEIFLMTAWKQPLSVLLSIQQTILQVRTQAGFLPIGVSFLELWQTQWTRSSCVPEADQI